MGNFSFNVVYIPFIIFLNETRERRVFPKQDFELKLQNLETLVLKVRNKLVPQSGFHANLF